MIKPNKCDQCKWYKIYDGYFGMCINPDIRMLVMHDHPACIIGEKKENKIKKEV